MPEHTSLYNTGGRPFDKTAAAFTWVKEHVNMGEHVHVISREETICWNGSCPTMPLKINIRKGMKL